MGRISYKTGAATPVLCFRACLSHNPPHRKMEQKYYSLVPFKLKTQILHVFLWYAKGSDQPALHLF